MEQLLTITIELASDGHAWHIAATNVSGTTVAVGVGPTIEEAAATLTETLANPAEPAD